MASSNALLKDFYFEKSLNSHNIWLPTPAPFFELWKGNQEHQWAIFDLSLEVWVKQRFALGRSSQTMEWLPRFRRDFKQALTLYVGGDQSSWEVPQPWWGDCWTVWRFQTMSSCTYIAVNTHWAWLLTQDRELGQVCFLKAFRQILLPIVQSASLNFTEVCFHLQLLNLSEVLVIFHLFEETKVSAHNVN